MKMAPIFVVKMLIFAQVQLSALRSPSECATNCALALLRTAAVAELEYQQLQHIRDVTHSKIPRAGAALSAE